MSSRRERAGGLAGALVVGGGAADPVEELGRLLAGLQDPHVDPVGPVCALGLLAAPRVLRALEVAHHRPRLGREPRLDHHEAAAQVDDVVDVLDGDRALAHAGAARDAVPDHVLRDGAADQGRRLERLATSARRERLRPLGEELVAQVHDQELRRELLARRVGRAHVLAAPALGAGHRVDHLLPGHVGDRRGAEAHRGLVLGREVERLEAPARPGPREPDVDPRGRDVQVLRVRQVGEEGEHEQDVRPHEDALGDLRPLTAREEGRQRVRDGRPARRPLVQVERDAARVPEEERADDPGDHREDEVRLAEVAPLEPLGPLDLPDPERCRDADQHERREHVDEQREPALAAEPRERPVAVDRPDHRHHDRGEQHDEAPEDERVHEARDEALEELLLPEDDDGLVADPGRRVARALGRLPEPDDPDEQERPSREDPARDHDRREERWPESDVTLRLPTREVDATREA